MKMIRGVEIGAPSAMAAKYRSMDLAPFMEDYLEDRLRRYQRIFEQIKSAGIRTDDTYGIAVLLWDQDLFFEVHEWLEEKWLAASGPEKELLQALIRAAGTYVHLKHGRKEGAEKMAAKAVTSLKELKEMDSGAFDVERLIAKLSGLDPVPPKFSNPASSF